MPVKWNKTKFPGVRYYEHPTRKHGISYDRYYAIRYQHSGRIVEEGIGWASQGHNADEANAVRSRLKNAATNGTGAKSQAEERKEAQRVRAKQQAAQQEQERQQTTFGHFFETVYLPQAQADKAKATWEHEYSLFRNWIAPVLEDVRFDEISIDHLDKIKRNMAKGKRPAARKNRRDRKKGAKDAHLRRNPARPLSQRTILYALAVVRQTWNRATASNPPLAFGEWPGASKAFRMPKNNSGRQRFLTKNEAALLLSALQKKSPDLHDMALLSLHCGLRAGEIFKLTWDKVNLPRGEILLVDTKNGESRTAFLTDDATQMLRRRSINCEHPRYIFVSRIGRKKEIRPYTAVPVTFGRTVKELGLNEGVTDDRDKIVFHSLRHTYASWLVEHGANLPTVRDLLGHKSLVMTSRYSHVSAEAQRNAVAALNQSLKPTGDNVIELHKPQEKE